MIFAGSCAREGVDENSGLGNVIDSGIVTDAAQGSLGVLARNLPVKVNVEAVMAGGLEEKMENDLHRSTATSSFNGVVLLLSTFCHGSHHLESPLSNHVVRIADHLKTAGVMLDRSRIGLGHNL
jgi:hypothetical protein